MSSHLSDLAGNVAIVTGSGRGIGRAVALVLAQRGADVAVAARNTFEIEEVAALVRSSGRKALAVRVDLTDSLAPTALVSEVERGLGPVTILANVAGLSGPFGAAWESDASEWERVLHTNLVAPYLLMRRVVPGMLQRGWGRIINVSSGGAQVPFPRQGAYSTSKAALDMLTRQFAAELSGTGVAVTAIYPGLVDTPAAASFRGLPTELIGAETAQRLEQMHAKGAFQSPERPARLIAAIAAAVDAALNGHIIDIHGEEGRRLLGAND
jgi:NAD(P)-dependent dehydrogenase (short-subunit alcohol dehydrogenase family)